MSNTTIALRSSGATGNVPNALSLAYGEFALNYADGIIYYRTDSDTVGSILTTQPSGLDKEIQFNDLGSFGSSANLSFNKTTGLLSTSRIYVSANAQVVGNVTANKLISNNSIGNSGGELLLAKPAANTILDGLGITIDAFQNKIRFYEQGGTNRGAYIDLTEAAANVGTNLLAGSGVGGNNVLQYRSSYTANSGQTSFAATYIPGYVDTFINGVKLTPGTDFTATNGTTITLSEGAVANDSVEIIGYVTVATTLPDAIQHRYSYTANAAQTTFAAVYVAPYVDVFKNGVRLSPTANYIANNGTEVVLTAGAALADLIEIVGYSSYTATVGQADQLTTGRTIGMTGDVTWTSNSFNGTANVTGTSTLANTGVTAGTYTKVTVDAKGRITTGNTLSSSDIPTLNQNTTGNAATANNVSGGTANVTTLTTSSTVTHNGGTANGVAYLNGSKVLTTGSALTFDGSNLGIGTSSPSQKFHVIGNALLTPSTWGTSGNSAVYLGDTNNYVSATFGGATTLAGFNDITFVNTQSGLERMRITAGGNVGIGNNNPGYPLDVTSASDSVGIKVRGRTSDNVAAIVFDNNAGAAGAQINYIQSLANGYLAVGTNNTERVRVTSAGNVGIGTNSPGARLHTNNQDAANTFPLVVSNNITGTDIASAGIGFDAHGTRFAQIVGGQQTNGTYADGNLGFFTRGAETVAERMRITSTGNVGIGTNAPAAKLTVAGSFATGGIRIQDTDASQAAPALEVIGQRSDGNGSVSFSGKALLARHRTDAAITFGMSIGGILFGGNHTSNSASNILYSASITGYSEGTFSSSSSMPTGLAFLTGFPGISPDTANASAGNERMRIDSTGNIRMGDASAADTAGRFFDIYNTCSSSGAYAITRLITQQVASSSTTSADIVKYKNGTLAINNNDTNSATNTVFGIGAAERLRIDSSGNLSSAGGQYRTRYYQTGSFIPGSTNWMRLCTMPATNQGQHIEFIFAIPGVHVQFKVKFSKTTHGGPGGGGILEVEQLGSYVYWSYYPFDWRLVDQGTNSPSHIDIRFPHNAGETIEYRINVLHSWSPDAPQHPTFPLTNLGSGTTGSRYVNMGSNTATWTKQMFKLTGSNHMYLDYNMTIFSGQTAPTA